ncbi:MAG: adenylosuccinate lyase, partial [Bacteroidetes bacterium]
MDSAALHAIAPIDGRYAGKTKALSAYFSEYALIRYRLMVEVEYFIALCEQRIPQLTSVDTARFDDLRNLYL